MAALLFGQPVAAAFQNRWQIIFWLLFQLTQAECENSARKAQLHATAAPFSILRFVWFCEAIATQFLESPKTQKLYLPAISRWLVYKMREEKIEKLTFETTPYFWIFLMKGTSIVLLRLAFSTSGNTVVPKLKAYVTEGIPNTHAKFCSSRLKNYVARRKIMMVGTPTVVPEDEQRNMIWFWVIENVLGREIHTRLCVIYVT